MSNNNMKYLEERKMWKTHNMVNRRFEESTSHPLTNFPSTRTHSPGVGPPGVRRSPLTDALGVPGTRPLCPGDEMLMEEEESCCLAPSCLDDGPRRGLIRSGSPVCSESGFHGDWRLRAYIRMLRSPASRLRTHATVPQSATALPHWAVNPHTSLGWGREGGDGRQGPGSVGRKR
ncbi:hypothetical protein DPEC_G00036880 [Dallia pectoralis]|uniref:Uncharacterized protein n=1 Tax=Dallia pectoralis TaxID=75939 RepID=A0ACC2HDM9_DALPE|nr:hypothetical protein DPEC_G00036880 [Dallia pectoralis]